MEVVGQLTAAAHDFNNHPLEYPGSPELLEARRARACRWHGTLSIGTAQASVMRAAALTQRLLAFRAGRRSIRRPLTHRLVSEMADLDPSHDGAGDRVSKWSARVDYG
jgi:hypothetical protein